ncbi:MAG: hypothetical protein IH905_16375 [Proteobacteria bacterium]|nr:hypothetical protein [Pseudomonadota bacterium]
MLASWSRRRRHDLPYARQHGGRFVWRIEGVLEFRPSGQLALEIPTRTRFEPNSDEYSYRLTIQEEVVQQDAHGTQRLRKVPQKPIAVRRSWRGRVW